MLLAPMILAAGRLHVTYACDDFCRCRADTNLHDDSGRDMALEQRRHGKHVLLAGDGKPIARLIMSPM